ncbi:citrate synthase [Erythrobacter mangrovi]|uniref:citrate synthase (unknown stereospecificity) n=1 Tax=Erythrobacter mangrovi TaxID=2739433 RepID=A0A7D3XGZ1_9SPHN|nr:citrate synthase [Erythrobacter mangrovi]QKG70718.1 citrate synthase [Erythrobacter mangrovi]
MNEWMTREEAIARLGVKPQTLYAYASRGLVGRTAQDDDPRRSLYRSADVEALAKRRKRGRATAAIAASTLSWGEPTLPTSISTVREGELIYRELSAAALAQDRTLEQVAALLWQVDAVEFPACAPADDPFMAVAELARTARPTVGRSREKLAQEACAAVSTIAASQGAKGTGPMHLRLAEAFGSGGPGAECVRRILVLLADHELNPSTFAARIAASTGASMPACILAGLATLSGPKHGGAGAALDALLGESETRGATAAVDRWLASGLPLPGFGHPLYPAGDPRAKAILATFEPDEALNRLSRAASETGDALPNVDFAILAAARAHGWPPNSTFSLFAIARTVGWAAHAMEQMESGAIIRPRGIYRAAA